MKIPHMFHKLPFSLNLRLLKLHGNFSRNVSVLGKEDEKFEQEVAAVCRAAPNASLKKNRTSLFEPCRHHLKASMAFVVLLYFLAFLGPFPCVVSFY